MSTWRSVGAGWRVHVPVVLGNAAVQAAAAWSFATPGLSFAFVALALLSYLALAASLALVAAQARAYADGAAFRLPTPSLWATAAVLVLLVGVVSFPGAAIVTPTASAVGALLTGTLSAIALVALPAAAGLIVLPGAAGRPFRPFAGFRAFAVAPLRSVGLLVLTLVVLVLLWIGAMLLGLLVTGWVGAGLAWLAFGVVGVLLVTGWTELAVRAVPWSQRRTAAATTGPEGP